jgi:hypothetical protein
VTGRSAPNGQCAGAVLGACGDTDVGLVGEQAVEASVKIGDLFVDRPPILNARG